MQFYFCADDYAALVERLASRPNAPRCPWSGDVDRDAIKITLGEERGVWPLSILGDVLCHGERPEPAPSAISPATHSPHNV